MAEKASMAPPPHEHQMQASGVVITPLHDELPASVPAGYPTAEKNNGGNITGSCVEGKATAGPGNHGAQPSMFYNQPSYQQMQAGMPAAGPPVAQGATMGPLDLSRPLFCPREQDGPTFLGATVGHHPIPIHCGACGYQGLSHTMQTRGWAHSMWAMMTCGLGLLLPGCGLDTHHFCPQCGKHVADAKLM